MTEIHTLIFENIPLCFTKYIKTKNNILRGNMDGKYYGFKLSNISITNTDKTFSLEISETEKEIKIIENWMFRYLRYLYKNKYKIN